MLNPPECEGVLFEDILLVPSLVGLAVGFSVGREGSDTFGPPTTVLLVGGSGKEAGGEDPEGSEGGVEGNVDGGGTSEEGGLGGVSETDGGDACEGVVFGGFSFSGGVLVVGGLGKLAGGGGDGEIGREGGGIVVGGD